MKYFIQAAQQDDIRQCFKPSTPKGPGFVVYIIAPNDDMPLTGLEAQEREVELKAFRSEFTAPKTLLILTENSSRQSYVSQLMWCFGIVGNLFRRLPPSSTIFHKGADFSAIRAAAVQSDATVVLTARMILPRVRFLEEPVKPHAHEWFKDYCLPKCQRKKLTKSVITLISYRCHILLQECLEPGCGGRQKGATDGR